MPAPTRDPTRLPRLADRLAAAQRAHFVGRLAEVELFRAALTASEPAFSALYLYGPGGVGKTALLGEYARVAADTGTAAVRLDARDLDPSPGASCSPFASRWG